MIGDLGDSRFIASIVEYNYQWLKGNYENYWDGFFMYPDKEVISYSDNLLGITPVYALLRIFGFDLFTSFQLLIIICHILNFTFCFICFHKFTGNKYAAACGAFIFAFGILLNGVHNHPQYTFRFCIPLFFYFLSAYLNTYNFRSLIFSVIFLVLQFYLGIYLGYFLLITGALFLGCYFFIQPSPAYSLSYRFKKLLLHSIPAALLFSLLVLPMFYFYYKRNQTSGYYTDYDFYLQTIPRFSSYLRSFTGSVTWSFLNNTEVNSKYEWVHILFPGALVFISILFSAYLAIKKQKFYLIILLSLSIFILFTINFNGHTLYGYLMKIPGIKAARVVSRVTIVLIFFAGWLLCLNITYLYDHFPRTKKILIALLPLVLFFDNYCISSGFKSFNKEDCNERINKLERKIIEAPNYRSYKAFAYTPGIKREAGPDSYPDHIDAMLCALKLKMKTVNGYSSSAHKEFGPFWRDIDSTSLAGWAKAMNLPMDSVLIVK